jgi:hypothetical protein
MTKVTTTTSVDLFPNQKKFRSELIFSNSPLILPKRLLPKTDEQQNQISFKQEFHGVTLVEPQQLEPHEVEKKFSISNQESVSKKVPKYMMKLMRFNDSLVTKHFE